MSMSKFLMFKNAHSVVKGYLTSLVASPSHSLVYLLQIHPFSSTSSSALKSLDMSVEIQDSFTVNYLINSRGLTPERATSASKYMSLKGADKADSVLTFFKDQGFTQTQISKLINSFPLVLICNPEKNYLPKIEFLKSKGISRSELPSLLCRSPTLLSSSLEKRLIPMFNLLVNILKSEELANVAFKSLVGRNRFRMEKNIKPNIKLLEEAGVPFRSMRYFLTSNPGPLMYGIDKFRGAVEEVKNMGFDPLKLDFLMAVHALLSTAKLTRNRKIQVFKQWGFSDNDFAIAFRKNPSCLFFSEDKINTLMEFLVNKMGLKSSFLAQRPRIFKFSFERKIAPRSLMYQALVSKGLMKPCDTGLTTMITHSEKRFIEMITRRFENEAPELLKLYKEKLDLAN